MNDDMRNQQLTELTARLVQRDQELATLRRDQQSSSVLISLVEVMSSELDLDQLLKKMVFSAVDLLRASNGAIGLVDEERRAIHHPALYNLPAELINIDVTEGLGISGQVYALKRPVIIPEYSLQLKIPIDDARLREIKAVMGVPIWWQGRFIGVFSIGTTDPNRAFDQRDVDALVQFAKHAAIAIENARLYGESRRLAHLEERNRIARDLHDSITQSLFTVVLMIDAVRNFLRSGQDAASAVELLYQTARDALIEMRALIYELRPAALESDGLGAALHKMANAVQVSHGLPIETRLENAWRISPDREEALFRIAQEAVNNIVKHAHASQATIELEMTANQARLVVSDDGIGFDQTIQSPPSGLGLATMRERTEKLNGYFAVQSAPQRGTHIEVRVPLEEKT